jgi:hypothetical protein
VVRRFRIFDELLVQLTVKQSPPVDVEIAIVAPALAAASAAAAKPSSS